ncbi:MAG: FecR family protein [Alphaproteobacteria bacterium]
MNSFYKFPRWMLRLGVLALAILLTQIGPSSDAANPVGTVHAVSLYAYGTIPGGTRTALYQNDYVFSGQVVETVEKGGLSILFNDGTEFRLGSAASMTLDKYVYDGKTKKGALAINMVNGMFRFTTGSIGKESVQLKTPVATIGIRGTDFGVAVNKQTGNTLIQVFSGAVIVGSKSSNAPELVKAGEYITVSAQGTSIHTAPYFITPPSVGPSANVMSAESDRDGSGGDTSSGGGSSDPGNDAGSSSTSGGSSTGGSRSSTESPQ